MTTKYEILRTSFFVKWFDEQTREVARKITDGVLNLCRGNFSNFSFLNLEMFSSFFAPTKI